MTLGDEIAYQTRRFGIPLALARRGNLHPQNVSIARFLRRVHGEQTRRPLCTIVSTLNHFQELAFVVFILRRLRQLGRDDAGCFAPAGGELSESVDPLRVTFHTCLRTCRRVFLVHPLVKEAVGGLQRAFLAVQFHNCPVATRHRITPSSTLIEAICAPAYIYWITTVAQQDSLFCTAHHKTRPRPRQFMDEAGAESA